MKSTLVKARDYEEFDETTLWVTDAYELVVNYTPPRNTAKGYLIINRETGQVEMEIDQEPQAIMAMIWLQEQYEEIMPDPMREYKVRKQGASQTTNMLERALAGRAN